MHAPNRPPSDPRSESCDRCGLVRVRARNPERTCWACAHPVCAICLDRVRSTRHEALPCGHVLHSDCAHRLRAAGLRLCPLCRHPLPEKEEEEDEWLDRHGRSSPPPRRPRRPRSSSDLARELIRALALAEADRR